MKAILTALLTTGLLFGTVYEGTTADLGIDIPEGPLAAADGLLDNPEGSITSLPEGCVIETMSDEDPGSPWMSPVQRALAGRDEGDPSWPGFDWADDVIVFPGEVGTGQDFDLDASTGDLYAILDTYHATNDSIIVYRSQDGGETWDFWRATYSSTGAVSNPKIRVAIDSGGQTWVCMMYISNMGLRIRRMTPDQSESMYEGITADAVSFADLDADIGSGAWLYATYVPGGTNNVRAARNALDGAGWIGDQQLFFETEVTGYPAIAAGINGTVGVAFVDDRLTDPAQVRIKRSTDYGVNWAGSQQVSNSAALNLHNPDIAFSRNSPQEGWIIATFEWADYDNLGFYYSTDSGGSWTYGDIFYPSGDDQNMGSLRSTKSSGSVTLSYNSDPGDSVMFAWSSVSDPSSFSDPYRINDFPVTGLWPSCAGWMSTGGSYSAVIYTDYANNYRVMYDWFDNSTGIDGDGAYAGPAALNSSPNPFSAGTRISFTLTQNAPVNISIYNTAGQLVRTLAEGQTFSEGENSVNWDGRTAGGTMAAPGVYFCRVTAADASITGRMLMIR